MLFILLVLILLFFNCVWPNVEYRQSVTKYIENIFCLPPSELEKALKDAEQLSENSESSEKESDKEDSTEDSTEDAEEG
jgi:hypothetical protein